MQSDLLQKLRKYFEASPILCGMPASEADITSAQRRLNCQFVREYVEFLRLFGCGVVGPDPIYGLGADHVAAMAEDDDVVTQTERFRAHRWPGVANWYIISMDGRGNPIGLDADGRVWLSDHDAHAVVPVADDFETFLAQNLAR